jgi:hypothetical protein
MAIEFRSGAGRYGAVAGAGEIWSNIGQLWSRRRAFPFQRCGKDRDQLGIVSCLNRPGGNVTGVSYFTKRTRGEAPGTVSSDKIAMVVNPRNPNAEAKLKDGRMSHQRK